MLPGSPRGVTGSGDERTSQFTFPGRDGVEITAYRWDAGGRAARRRPADPRHGRARPPLRRPRRCAHRRGVRRRRARTTAGTAPPRRPAASSAARPRRLGSSWSTTSACWPAGREPSTRTCRYVLVAHSMGSFAAQQYLLDHSAEVTAVALTGTSLLDVLEPALDLDAPLDLSRVQRAVRARPHRLRLAVPRRGTGRRVHRRPALRVRHRPGRPGKAMFAGARAVADPARLAAMRTDLPVYLAVGELDPVGGQTALVTRAGRPLPRGRPHRRHAHRLPGRPARGLQRDQPRRGRRRPARVARPCHRVRVRADGLSEVVGVLREWQYDGAPMQLHPGDMGWYWRFGAEATAAAVRTWSQDGSSPSGCWTNPSCCG